MRLWLPNQISVFVCIACSLLYVVWSISAAFFHFDFLFWLSFLLCSFDLNLLLWLVDNSLDTVEDYLVIPRSKWRKAIKKSIDDYPCMYVTAHQLCIYNNKRFDIRSVLLSRFIT